MTIDLKPVPSEEWQAEWDRLMQDDWLRRKLNRTRRLIEHRDYLERFCPELFDDMELGLVIDLGPGAGETLEIAREAGHEILGVDAPSGDGGMGDAYLRASRLMHWRQQIPTSYVRVMDWLKVYIGKGRAALINSRGSIEQILSEHLEGPPHHEHQDCHKLNWRETSETVEAFRMFFERCCGLLRPGGILLIAANGTGTPESEHFYFCTVYEQAYAVGLTMMEADGKKLVHKWVK